MKLALSANRGRRKSQKLPKTINVESAPVASASVSMEPIDEPDTTPPKTPEKQAQRAGSLKTKGRSKSKPPKRIREKSTSGISSVGRRIFLGRLGTDKETRKTLERNANDHEAELTRTEFCQQIVEKQRQCVKLLKSLNYNWIKQPFGKKKANETLSASLFVGIEPLLNLEVEYYKALKQKIEQNPEDPLFGEPFSNLCKKADVFINYASNFGAILDAYRQLVDDPKWREWNQDCKAKAGPPFHLTDLLLFPLERLPEVLHLIRKFRDITPTDHKDYATFSGLEQQIRQGADSIEATRPGIESKMRMLRVYETVTIPEGKSCDILAASRRYLDDAPLDFEADQSRKRGHVYLLNDMILITEIMPKSSAHQFIDTISVNNLDIKDMTDEHSGSEEGESDVVVSSNSQPSYSAVLSSLKPVSMHSSSSENAFNVSHLPPLVSASDYESFRVEETTKPGTPLDLTLDDRGDVYAKVFKDAGHHNFLGMEPDTVDAIEGTEYFVYSVLAEPMAPVGSGTETTHKVLKTYKRGYRELQIKVPSGLSGTAFTDALEKAIIELENGNKQLYLVANSNFPNELAAVDALHSHNKFKLGVILCRKGQTDPKKQMLKNQVGPVSDLAFNRFLSELGDKINLERWGGFRGDMLKGEAYHTKWRDCEVIYHVAPFMDKEEHRRLIGNDLAIVMFVEKDAGTCPQFDLNRLGQVPQVFIIVQAIEGSGPCRYRVSCISRKSLVESQPLLPLSSLDGPSLKDFILTKVHNSLVQTRYSPPFDKLFYKPRAAALRELTVKFPPPPSNSHLFQMAKKLLHISSSSLPTLPIKPSFALTSGEITWNFICDSAEEATEWVKTFQHHYTDDRGDDLPSIRSRLQLFADKPSTESPTRHASPLHDRPVRSALSNAKSRILGNRRVVGLDLGPSETNGVVPDGKTELPAQIDLKAVVSLPGVGSRFIAEFRKYMEDNRELDLFGLYVDIINFRVSFHTSEADLERDAEIILQALHEKKGSTSLATRLNLHPLATRKASGKMFDGYFIEVQAAVQRSYSKFVSSSTTWALSSQASLLRRRSQSLLTQEHLLKQVPYNFNESLLAQYPDLILTFGKYLKKHNSENLLLLFVNLHKFKRSLYITPEKVQESARALITKWQDLLISLSWKKSKSKGDDYSQAMFDPQYTELQEKLNTKYTQFIDGCSIKSTTAEDLKEIERKLVL